ncbi:helix-turn-helix domain-containing protein [Velocimicrobium porci]|uniref:Helix-turn-helix transcriptional regulator n=1 Tax=Velocimicrobium porci TaxID=2606634 RepID=A0A6L5XY99_9FIRM|nr:helix-turn-helix transcriptional regulator [Velocimicrobium porci]MSS63850.1 helix-turn-helix transcriptional regulator [Velocimicrobium porci]
MNYIIFGKKIRDERLKLHLTQEKLGKEVNLSTAYIGQIERGERSLTLDNLEILTKRLGISIDYLLSESMTNKEENTNKLWLQLVNERSKEEKQMAVDIIQSVFAALDNRKKQVH